MTGQKFGRLKVVNRAENYIRNNGRQDVCWNCICDCGNTCVVKGDYLRNGGTKSCGCYNKEIAKSRMKKYNQFDMSNDYGICYAGNTNDQILFDKEDFDLIKDLYWVVTNSHDNCDYKRVQACVTHGCYIRFHNAIINVPKGHVVDHINRNPLDNRKCNLRICTQKENVRNRRQNTNNKLGVKGVYQIKNGSYCSKIECNGKVEYLGLYKTIAEAANAYDTRAKELFGEFAYLNNYSESEVMINEQN